MIYELRQTTHRKYYLRIADYFSRLGFTPNTWTIIGLFMGFFMSLMIYFQYYLYAMIFGLVMAFCDIMDGEIAKLKNNTTPFGRLLDVMVDKYVEGFVGLAAGLSMPAVLFPSLVWGILSVWGSILISVVSNIGGIITDKKPVKLVGRGDRGILILIGLIGGMIRPVFFTYSVIIITVLSHITVIHMLIQYDLILKKEEMKKKVNKEVHEASISSSLEPEREIVPSGV